MVHQTKVNFLIKQIGKYLKELQSLGKIDLDVLDKNKEKRYTLAFLIQQIVNECISLGNHIISEFDLGTPETYKNIFEILEKKGFISKEISTKMKEFVEIRNIIAHVYRAFSNRDLIRAYRNIDWIEKYVNSIIEKIESR